MARRRQLLFCLEIGFLLSGRMNGPQNLYEGPGYFRLFELDQLLGFRFVHKRCHVMVLHSCYDAFLVVVANSDELEVARLLDEGLAV